MHKREESWPRLKLMFVDDDPQVLELLRCLVEPLGCEVLTTADSQEAAERIRKEKLDGIFLDAQMPHLDGFELAQVVRHSASNSTIPIAMITGCDDAETMRKAFQAGVTSFIGKPVTPSRLSSLLMAMRGAILREKRRCERLPLSARVTWIFGNRRFESEGKNISEGGMLIEGWPLMPMGQELDLQFAMPKASRPLKPHVKVIRRELPNRVAVKFLYLDESELGVVLKYLSAK